MTYEDGGYADKPGKGTGWKDSHDKVAAWLLGGESDKIASGFIELRDQFDALVLLVPSS